ncbi:MAG: hypothetical protein M1481_02560 [Candidatus Thermoplasmatota archaeon]|jgi:hypothetical protein|nr:hypothetical protein [Candidatus Thermoplasmatota archaeon]MCL5963816.1 hypothetical protein [Candidatus Thermoplasmatota archaeon]
MKVYGKGETYIRIIGMLYAIISFIAGYFIGIFRLFKDNYGYHAIFLNPWYHVHSFLMIFGFLGGLLMTERIVGTRTLPWQNRFMISLSMISLSIIGLIMLTSGWALSIPFIAITGGIFLFISSSLFTYFIYKLAILSHDYQSFMIMAAGTTSLGVSSILAMLYLPVNDYPFILLMLSFPLLFVVGERIELSRFKFVGMNFKKSFILVISWSYVFILSVSASLFYKSYSYSILLLTISGFLLLSVIFIVFYMDRVAAVTVKQHRLSRYLYISITIAYIWAIIGIVFFILRSNGVTGFYDPGIHAIALGFIVTFIFAHGALIFPTLLNKKLNVSKLSYWPLIILTTANVMRIGGDLIKLYVPVGYNITNISGIVFGISAIWFVANMYSMMH